MVARAIWLLVGLGLGMDAHAPVPNYRQGECLAYRTYYMDNDDSIGVEKVPLFRSCIKFDEVLDIPGTP